MIMLLFFLLLVPSAWADTMQCEFDKPYGESWVTCKDHGVIVAKYAPLINSSGNKPDPCLAKMEQAMRANEPLIGKLYEDIRILREAINLWADAKACWRQP